MKTCRRCQSEKPLAEFRQDPRYRDGHASWCASCHRERNSEWAKDNRERLTAKALAWRAANPDKAAEANLRFKRANKSRLAAAHAKWAKANRDKRNATSARHKAAKLRATPLWADHEAIAAVYRRAAALIATGHRVHVDHIVPLQGETVCGLHCEANLQIIPGSANESKRNRWPPDAQRQGSLFDTEAA